MAFPVRADPSGEAVFSYLLRLFRRYQCCDKRRTGPGLFCLCWDQEQGEWEDSPWIGGKSLPRSASGQATRNV